MTVPEHTLYQGEIGHDIDDTIVFDAALNLTGATVQMVYSALESANKTVRSAAINPTPSFDEATSCSFQRAMTDLDTAEVGVFNYQWKLELVGGEILYFPLSAPTADFPERKMPCFEVVASVDAFFEVSDSESSIATRAYLIASVTEENFQLTSISRDSDSVITSASVIWTDGSSGVFTTTKKNPTFLTIDAFTITHATSGKTVTQPEVTRDPDGNVTVKPALTITP